MISTLKGKLIKISDSSLLIDVNGVGYEVFIALTVLNELQNVSEGDEISLVTYHYYASDPSKSFPILIGFMNEIEREFFVKFISVSGVGPKAAVKAINRPISEIAGAIDKGDVAFLKSLPGIGEQRAKEIVAKLQNKIGKFGLIQDSFKQKEAVSKKDIEEEALQVLVQLQYKKHEAQAMLKKAIERNPDISSSEDLLNEVYRQKKDKS
ncbi:MAG: Holliday junction branch migration protein RuvA [Candidatus Omnitrophica bacterium]|nr:Holliday junction branch migration protein RuvA [Candidatus Omnitrophota bacterium]